MDEVSSTCGEVNMAQVHKCCWLLGAIGSNEYCHKPTKYHVGYDDDGNKVRKYDHLCPKHKVELEKMEQDDSEF